MPNLNLVQIMGNLTRDPDLTYTPKGTACCDIGVAVNRIYRNERDEKVEEVTFVDVTFWGTTAEVIGEHFKKGRPIYVQGRLKLDTWDDRQSGQKRSKLRVIGESFQFLGSKEDSRQERRESAPQQQAPPRQQQQKPRDPDLDQPEDDIPF